MIANNSNKHKLQNIFTKFSLFKSNITKTSKTIKKKKYGIAFNKQSEKSLPYTFITLKLLKINTKKGKSTLKTTLEKICFLSFTFIFKLI